MASSTWWRAQAASCRRVAREVDSPRLRSILLDLADEYQARAKRGCGARSRDGAADPSRHGSNDRGGARRRGRTNAA
jgi:hypothetical protein